ncbi:splicing factor SF3a60 homolog [Chenopodium quinoa]|uniref:splicing factor SF3a60 homolog n=1 Tax=Chenopodium quinoa TaxID=63459 RepID=UPI000B799841|nr:splicing factor SF3a60 homolog [Chenopodium quinoa]XP_021764148.1 splicing factor SF3a60 homolog [Chenopodium quinoa]XP_021764158.1 splicing factor SF3a60 homolog [Chenopodium quinoa]XP_021764167.1 splicing factor SF3a60 homolog [Chenopodium quinoa]XP_021764177.1 splicing factor SF3a60 homolog [Chenopodium quinoa]XP_021764181.1 splicing factor SF3a60 homolog [Chenopodium quinoa]XP_021764187.1 splicing factor SF3a60 homolog [Chenopodium quinoa]
MSSTLLELTRGSHEEVERLERLIVKELQNEGASSRDRLLQSHRVRFMIEHILSTTDKLVEIYEDKDGARKDEIAALGGQTATGTNVFSAFYDRLKEIREYHRRHPSARVIDAEEEYEQMFKEDPLLDFSGEEASGRYLDLHEFYNRYINSKFGEPMDYVIYLEKFSQPHMIPCKRKMTRQYKEYIIELLEYLISFFERTEPLKDLDRIFSKVVNDFEEQWANGKVKGWENEGQENGHISQTALIDLDYYSTVDELLELGPEKLKEALAALGLKTGGTIQQRAERLFLTKNTPLEKLDKKHFAKPQRGSKQNGNGDLQFQKQDDIKELALVEAKMVKLCELLEEIIVRTKENSVKKQGMTYEELALEHEEEDVHAESESDEEDQPIYNPLKLPLGWDGKPIPYWLYKLHGLGQEFKCEICGNHSYWGRRAFERHFKEWRHQHGMRCLGIPNTKNFNEITSIQDAKNLWEKIQRRQGLHKWRPDLEEEYEDKEGNIYNKKTYTDLQRQGLI